MNLPLNIDLQQILLHLFNFVILAGGLYFLLYKPVKSFMDLRWESYRKLDEEASSRAAKARQLEEEYHRRLEDARSEIDAKRVETIKQAQDTGDRIIQEARDEAAGILAKAREEAVREKERILKEAQGEITDLAILAAEKLLAANSGDAVFDQFLDAAKGGEEGWNERGKYGK